MKKILLACGMGASSGFLANQMKKAAKTKKIDVEIKAISEADIKAYIDKFDVVMLGPHIRYRFQEISDMLNGTNKKVVMINEKAYAELDGEAVLQDALKELEND